MIQRRIEWTESARRRVVPRRMSDVPPPPALDREALWTQVRSSAVPARVGAELTASDARLRPAVQEALELLQQPAPPGVTAAAPWAVVLFLTAGKHRSVHETPVDFLLASASLQTVVRIWTEAMGLTLERGRASSAAGAGDVDVVRSAERSSVVWASRNLRYALLREPPSTRQWAREQLGPSFAQGTLRLRAEVLSVLPNEADWAALIARELVEAEDFDGPEVDHLLAALADPQWVSAVLERAPAGLWRYECALDGLGLDAVPALLAVGRRPQKDFTLERLLGALAIVCDEDVARFMASLPRRKGLQALVEEHRARFPELAALLAPRRSRRARE